MPRRSNLKLTEFSQAVIAIVRKIPKGKVATYAQVAALAGKPHAARGVGWILNSCAGTYGLPWQRVLNSKGRISFERGTPEYTQQERLLKREGVRFIDAGQLDLDVYRWQKKPKAEGKPRMFR